MRRDGIRIGLVEDDPIMGESLAQRLGLEGHDVRWWLTGREAMRDLPALANRLDLVICDIRLPDISGEDVFRSTARTAALPPFLFITGHADIDQAVRLMRSGAVDFITKPFKMDDFLDRIGHTVRPRALAESGGALGVSPAMRQVEATLERYAGHDLPVLVTGETGVGKEVAARFFHRASKRRDQPFVAVNCAAIPAELMESELFGHEKGAFTGAAQRHLGYAERAGRGILFLDEIGDMPLALQPKLLRLIESGSFHRVGGEQPVPFRAQIVSASHQDLARAAAEGAFRQDLFFRISALPVAILPLRQRPEDVSWLLDRFLAEMTERDDCRIRGLSALAEEAALAHDWPGNVRELRNRLERAVALCVDERIMPADLFPELARGEEARGFPTLSSARDAAEKRQIERALELTGGQITQAARLLDISRTTLWEKMTRLGLNERARSDS
jgi:DNA-binding NtrC family response regulator